MLVKNFYYPSKKNLLGLLKKSSIYAGFKRSKFSRYVICILCSIIIYIIGFFRQLYLQKKNSEYNVF